MNNAPIELLQLLLICNSSKGQYSSLLVGGCVRDMRLNRDIKDYDIVTSHDLNLLKLSLLENSWKVSDVKMDNGMIILHVTKNNYSFEIANFRGDISNDINLLIQNDSDLRDFTINALYYDIINDNSFDPSNKGFDDLTNRVLRFNGKPEDRIKEDPLRMYRFYRFLHQLKAFGFTADEKSLKAVRKMFSTYNVNPERIRNELEKMI